MIKRGPTTCIKRTFLILSISRNDLSEITSKFSWKKHLFHSVEEITTVCNICCRCLIFLESHVETARNLSTYPSGFTLSLFLIVWQKWWICSSSNRMLFLAASSHFFSSKTWLHPNTIFSLKKPLLLYRLLKAAIECTWRYLPVSCFDCIMWSEVRHHKMSCFLLPVYCLRSSRDLFPSFSETSIRIYILC